MKARLCLAYAQPREGVRVGGQGWSYLLYSPVSKVINSASRGSWKAKMMGGYDQNTSCKHENFKGYKMLWVCFGFWFFFLL